MDMVRKKWASFRQRQTTGSGTDRKRSGRRGEAVEKRGVRRWAL